MTAHTDRPRNRFTGTLRDVRALRVEWSLESEKTLHEGRARLLLGALAEARAAGKIGERDYRVERGKLR
jgi:hypothetical protein